MDTVYDAMIIGSGVIGSAVARELSRYELKIGVLEKELDVCSETSGRNSAVIHGGFAYDIGTLKAKFCVEGCLEFDRTAEELDIPFKRTGKVLVGNTEEDLKSLEETKRTGEINGSRGLEIVDKKRLRELCPCVNGEFALYSPYSGIVDPFQYTIALAENAKRNGADFFFGHVVSSIRRTPEKRYEIHTSCGNFLARWVINCAGLYSDKVSSMLGIPGYRIGGFKGDYIILDKRVGGLLPMPAYPVPNNIDMGIHVTPTVDGTVTVGPHSEEVADFSYYGVPKQVVEDLAQSASRLWPHIRREDYIRNYSGIRPKLVDENGVVQDFVIEARDEAPNTVNLVGIESPGLTGALPIARYAVGLIKERETLKEKPDFEPRRKGIVRFSLQNDEEKARLIEQDPDYGEIVCRCETVTKAEILQAIRNPLGVCTMAAIKNRTRAMMGRCQGGYCQMRIAKMIQEETGTDVTEVLLSRKGSNLFTGRVRK